MTQHRPVRDEAEDALLQSGRLEGRVIASSPPRVSYSRQLLDVAKRFIDQGDYGIAVVVVHTACEGEKKGDASDASVFQRPTR
jgi:hypothetical protein